jgi:hypothetical protein
MTAYRKFDPDAILRDIENRGAGAAKVDKAAKVPGPAGATLATLATLAAVPSPNRAPAGDDPAAWRSWYFACADRWVTLGQLTLHEAMSLAYGAAQCAWHRRHGAKPTAGHCAGCGKPIAGMSVLALPDGARVHAGADWPCLAAYGAQWRSAAAQGLRSIGIEVSERCNSKSENLFGTGGLDHHEN